jgi:hypothetical protein
MSLGGEFPGQAVLGGSLLGPLTPPQLGPFAISKSGASATVSVVGTAPLLRYPTTLRLLARDTTLGLLAYNTTLEVIDKPTTLTIVI